ncbi:hypothetical protein [Acetobacter aceti]|uniref:Uncharacterized protein n=1 Tax=Acetobacter aceti TaxID=435 RepID=A0A6S6PMY3_ACEAC|nr:hypothetical protein [Acetobacter aceti]BCI68051.1 hypothetical protein AAJCM20276_26750 [Acetobacter aceti]
MDPTPYPRPAVQTAKAGGILGTLVTALTQLPEPYSSWVGYGLIGVGIVGLVATQIPAPTEGSRLMPVYRALSVLAANWGQAVNAGLMMRGKK